MFYAYILRFESTIYYEVMHQKIKGLLSFALFAWFEFFDAVPFLGFLSPVREEKVHMLAASLFGVMPLKAREVMLSSACQSTCQNCKRKHFDRRMWKLYTWYTFLLEGDNFPFPGHFRNF